MYDLEIFVGDPYPPLDSNESHREAWCSHEGEKIWINLTRIWELSLFKTYGDFLDELIGAIIHEFLHFFLHVSKIHQTEEAISYLTRYLRILSLGHLIGAGEEETEKDKADFQKWVDLHFKDSIL